MALVMAVKEQLGSTIGYGHGKRAGSGKGRKFTKRQTARAERREAKRKVEDAPKRRQYTGWYW